MTPRSKVAVLRTSPETVVEDYGRLMDLAGYREALPVRPADLPAHQHLVARLHAGLLDHAVADARA